MLYHWNIIGHEKELGFLEQDIVSKNLGHAYLFLGPSQIGKYSVAKQFAGILQCENNFCHSCPTCTQVRNGSHIDTLELKDDGESMKIEHIRNLIAQINLTTQSRYKILLIENIDRMTIEASNCLLKTLEEPPPRVIFLMTSSNKKAIRNTILSRVRLFHFSLLPEKELEAYLMDHFSHVPKETIDKILSFSIGKPGKALHLLNDSELFLFYEKIYNELESAMRNCDLVKQFALVEEICKEKRHIDIFLDIFCHFLRHILIHDIREKAKGIKICQLLKDVVASKQLIAQNVNPRLCLENLMLKI